MGVGGGMVKKRVRPTYNPIHNLLSSQTVAIMIYGILY